MNAVQTALIAGANAALIGSSVAETAVPTGLIGVENAARMASSVVVRGGLTVALIGALIAVTIAGSAAMPIVEE